MDPVRNCARGGGRSEIFGRHDGGTNQTSELLLTKKTPFIYLGARSTIPFHEVQLYYGEKNDSVQICQMPFWNKLNGHILLYGRSDPQMGNGGSKNQMDPGME